MEENAIEFNGWKMFEKLLVQGFRHFKITDEHFTGQITLHFNDGNLCDIDRFERSLRKHVLK